MWTIGTHINETDGATAGSKGGAKAAMRGPSRPWVKGTALGVPVVPLVNRTTASSSGPGPEASGSGVTGPVASVPTNSGPRTGRPVAPAMCAR